MKEIQKYMMSCQYCGSLEERSSSKTSITCFDCKRDYAKAYNLARKKGKSVNIRRKLLQK